MNTLKAISYKLDHGLLTLYIVYIEIPFINPKYFFKQGIHPTHHYSSPGTLHLQIGHFNYIICRGLLFYPFDVHTICVMHVEMD